MNVNITLLNVMTYTSKKTGDVLSQINYIFAEKNCKSNNKSFKGFGLQTGFFSGNKVFELIPYEWIGKTLVAHCEDRSFPDNPLETRKVIAKLEFDGKVIDLL